MNPHDEEALRRIINYPKRGIGLNTIDKLHRTSLEKNESMWQVLNNTEEININKGVQKKLTEFCLTINNFKINSKNTDAHTIAEEISKKTGILNELQTDKSPEGISRLENVQELLNGIKNFSETAEEENKISDFMQDVALLTDQDREEKKDFNKITLMTIHSAKGLEFPYVFVVGLEENMFPNMMSLESQEKLEEERRLFYVAITRAEKRLFLSFASTRFKWGQFIDCKPSRFIYELDQDCLEKHEHRSVNKQKEYNTYKIYRTPKTKPNKPRAARNLQEVNKTKNIKINESNLRNISSGIEVNHKKFGKGKIISISGEGSNKKAIVFFNNFGSKQLLLKFAKLDIIR